MQGADSRYDFGPLALRLGLAAIQRRDPIQATERALPDLVAETGFTALLAVWSNRGPTIVHWQRTGDLVTSLNLGSVLPVARSSLGRMLLAFLPAGRRPPRRWRYEAKREKTRPRVRWSASSSARARRASPTPTRRSSPASTRPRAWCAAGTARRFAPSR